MSASAYNDEISSLVETLGASLAQVEAIAERPRVTPHTRLLIQSANTASLTAKRLARALKGRSLETSPSPAGYDEDTLEKYEIFKGVIMGEICPTCGGTAPPEIAMDISIFLEN